MTTARLPAKIDPYAAPSLSRGLTVGFNRERAKERRLELKLTQFDVACKIVVKKNGNEKPLRAEYISDFETGRRNPGRTVFLLYATALGLDPMDLEIL